MPHQEARMAIALFVVKATITADREAEFNRWYNEEHCPQVLRYPGAVSARRYRAILGEDRFQYMAVYEFQDEATLQRFLASAELKALKAEYDRHFASASERSRFGYTQVWP
jgi:antibiotic biosynthesis monooxygenase (ABM) superfamily enzyme